MKYGMRRENARKLLGRWHVFCARCRRLVYAADLAKKRECANCGCETVDMKRAGNK